MGRKRHKAQPAAHAQTPKEHEARDRALHALNDMRKLGLSLTKAADDQDTTPATVRKYVGSALRRDKRGRYHATPSDRLTRRLEFLTAQGKISVTVRGSHDATRVAQHHNAVKRYLDTGDAEGLHVFQDQTLRVGKTRLPFLTDLAVLEDVVQGEPSFDSLYVRATG